MKNWGALYKTGSPGRGAGTILRTPDYSAIFARTAKMAADADRQKKAEEANQQTVYDKLVDIKNTSWVGDAERFDNDINDFTQHGVDLLTKYGSWADVPIAEKAQMQVEKSKLLNRINMSKLYGERYDKAAFLIYSDKNMPEDVRKEKLDKMAENASLPVEQRTDVLDVAKYNYFDYQKYITSTLWPQAKNAAEVSATQSGVLGTDKKYLNTNTYTKFTLPQSQRLFESTYISSPLFKQSIDEQYANWLNLHPDRTTIVEMSDAKGNITQQTKQVNSPLDYMNYVEAPRVTIDNQKTSVTGFGSGVSVSVEQPQTAPQRDKRQDSYTVDVYHTIKNKTTGKYEDVAIPQTYPTASQMDLTAYNRSGLTTEQAKGYGVSKTKNTGKIPGNARTIEGTIPPNESGYGMVFTNAPEFYIGANGLPSTQQTGKTKKLVTFYATPEGNIDADGNIIDMNNNVKTYYIDPIINQAWIRNNTVPGTYEAIMGLPYNGNTGTKQTQNNSVTGGKGKMR